MSVMTSINQPQTVATGKTYRAAVMPGPNAQIEIRELPRPQPDVGEVIMRTLYSEVCGTDVHIQKGLLDGVPYPIIPGHFSVGIVEEVNGSVFSITGRQVCTGEVITFLDVHQTCHRCWQCLVTKTPTKCPSRKIYGVTHSVDEGPLGGWSEIVLLKSDVIIAHLPEGVSPLSFISGGCAMPTAIHAVERSEATLGDLIVIQGAGPVGICAALIAQRSGADVILCDMAQVRLNVARQLGFQVIDLSKKGEKSASEPLSQKTKGRLADATIEATGVPEAILDGIRMTRDGGRYVIVGHYSNSGDTTLNPHLDINKKHLEIRGTWGIEYIHFHKAIDFIASFDAPNSEVRFEKIMTSIYSLEECEEALRDIQERRVVKAVISP